MFVLYPSIK